MICGIVGQARVGKDTFAGYLTKCLKERFQRNFKCAAFAAPLKSMCKDHFGLSDEQLWGDKKEELTEFVRNPVEGNWTTREIMQALGSFYRYIDYDFWVKALDRYLISNDIKDTIITDVRYVNECEFVKTNNGVLIKIVRGDADEIHGTNHDSETALNDMPSGYFDIEINNCGTLEDLYTAAEDSSDAIIITENMLKKGRTVKDGKE